MKHLLFSFDPVSPYAYLAFERLPKVLEGLNIEVSYQPILLAGLLQRWGQKGPAEIAPKRDWTYRQVLWLAHRHGVPLQLPAQHPFNPLALLRLLVASAPAGVTPNRWACEQVLRHAWQGGADANDASRVASLAQTLQPVRDASSAEVKEELKAATEAAASRGLFGVPTIEVEGHLFWGLDGLELLSSYLRGDTWFDSPAWDEAAAQAPGIRRTPSSA